MEKLKKYRGLEWYTTIAETFGDREELCSENYRMVDDLLGYEPSKYPNKITEKVCEIFKDLIITEGDKLFLTGDKEAKKRIVEDFYKKVFESRSAGQKSRHKSEKINVVKTLSNKEKTLRDIRVRMSKEGVHIPNKAFFDKIIKVLELALKTRNHLIESDSLHNIKNFPVISKEIKKLFEKLSFCGITQNFSFVDSERSGRSFALKFDDKVVENLKKVLDLAKLFGITYDNIKIPVVIKANKIVRPIHDKSVLDNISSRTKRILFVTGSMILSERRAILMTDVLTVLRESSLNINEDARTLTELLKVYSDIFDLIGSGIDTRITTKDEANIEDLVKKLNPCEETWIVPIFIGSNLEDKDILDEFPKSIKQQGNVWHIVTDCSLMSFKKLAVFSMKLRPEDFIIEINNMLNEKLKNEVIKLKSNYYNHVCLGKPFVDIIPEDKRIINDQKLIELEQRFSL